MKQQKSQAETLRRALNKKSKEHTAELKTLERELKASLKKQNTATTKVNAQAEEITTLKRKLDAAGVDATAAAATEAERAAKEEE
eukprot:SAG31_NODE_16286_length_715_cov_0.873377_1_plen_84_part_10